MAVSRARSRKTVERAFLRFVELVGPVPQVHHVVAFDDHDGDFFTFIKRRDEAVCKTIFHHQYQVMREFPDLGADFHVVYMEGRPLEQFISPLPGLVFSRSTSNAND